MNWKRIGRTLVCLLLVCCLIINISPIQARAIAIVDDLAIGLAALMIAAAAGVAINAVSNADVIAAGNSMVTYLYQWGTSAEKLDVVDDFVGGLRLIEFDPDSGDDDDTPHQTQVKLAQGILAGLTAWIASVCLNFIEVPVNDGSYKSYDSLGLPSLPSSYPDTMKGACVYVSASDGVTRLYLGETVLRPYFDCSELYDDAFLEYYGDVERYALSDGQWVLEQSLTDKTVFFVLSSLLDGEPLWTSHTVYTDETLSEILFLGADRAEDVKILAPDALLGDVAPGLSDGSKSESDIVLPDTLELGNIITSNDTAVQDLTQTLTQLCDQTLTYEDFLEKLEVQDESVVEPDTSTLADTALGTFLNRLSDIITAPFVWLADQLLEGIKAIFVPSEDYLTAKVEAIRAEFAFVDSVISSGQFLVDSLNGFGTDPPIIYIELGDAEGDYDWGVRAVALDLSWYARYKPTVDQLLSALFWALFIWRTLVKLPGIIGGMPGDFVMDSLQRFGLADRLPSRKAAYQVQRDSLRQSIRKGPGK